MKIISIPIKTLFNHYNITEYEKEYELPDSIFITDPDGDYVKVNHLIKKRTPMIKLFLEDNYEFVCAEKHLIGTSNGIINAKDAVDILVNGEIKKVLKIENLGEDDAFDISLNYPHLYKTTNGMIHHNTFVAMYKALQEVMDKGNSFQRIIIVRSSAPTRDQGFLPGNLEEKMSSFEDPYHQICADLFSRKNAYQLLKDQHHIEFVSTSYIRGCSFDNAIIIVDECQNMTFQELNTVITRVGNQSKIIFVGDIRQNDLLKKSSDATGLPKFIEIAKKMKSYTMITFTPQDIVRSSLVKEWIIASEEYED